VLEIEQKFAGADFAALEQKLAAWGARPGARQDEADHYFNAPDRDFARTDEVFRLRRIGAENWLTYKGPKQQASVKVRTELEVPLTPGDEAAADMTRLLKHLGYRPVAVVRKHRRMYHFDRGGFALTVCLDDVDELGRFTEVEILAPEDRRDAARDVVGEVASGLGLGAAERRSYLGLLLAARGEEKP
jgi:adenylate cyclase class 2